MATQTCLNEEFKNKNLHINEVIRHLTTKVENIATYKQTLETQISQVAQQQASFSIPQGSFMGKAEQNPKGQMNFVTIISGKPLVDPIEKGKERKRRKEKRLREVLVRAIRRLRVVLIRLIMKLWLEN